MSPFESNPRTQSAVKRRLPSLSIPSLVATLLVAAFAAARGAPAPADAGAGAAEMDRILASAFPPDAPGAAVLVVRDGTVILRKGYGLADLELGVPMDPADVFPICSVTKQFTAVAILQLVEAGKLKLTDDLSRFVRDYPTGGAEITLTELLGHTSGIPSCDALPEWRRTLGAGLTPDQALGLTRNLPLDFAPGSDWRYSNTGYALLGKVIEAVSGQSYPAYVRSRLFAPAGMVHSYYGDGHRLIARRVRGYSRAGKAWVDAPDFNLDQTFAAGALLSTVDDLRAWDQALQAGRLVSTSVLASAYVEGHLPDGRSTHYGLGWEVNRLGKHVVIEHSGGIPGFAAYEARVPDARTYVAILTNTNEPTVELRTLVSHLIRISLGETIAAPTFLSIHAAEDFVGEYRINGGAVFVVTARNNLLYGQLGPGRRQLKQVAPDEFATSGDAMGFTFLRDAAGHIKGILVRTDAAGPDLVWPRVEEARHPSS
jgi:CubicO group peptidase (beta-lactamase class C family)